MLGYNCLMKNTQLYKDLSDFVKKTIFERIAAGKKVSLEDLYREARSSNFWDVDINSTGEMYKDVRPEVEAKLGKGFMESDKAIDKLTGRSINDAIKKIISNKRASMIEEVGRDAPFKSITKSLLSLFEDDFIHKKGAVNKTVMKEMQDNIKKAAISMINRNGGDTKNKSWEEIVNEALRVDKLAVKDLNGLLNTMDDLFNQVSQEVDASINKMEASKKGLPKYKQDEIDQRIDEFKSYVDNIKQGAYTLALSRGEQQKVLRDILKEKYSKTITSNGQQKKVLDWNKMFSDSQDFKSDVSDILEKKGFTPEQIDKIVGVLKFQFDALKSTAQWNNASLASQKKAINDDKFISRAAAEVVMSKKDSKGEFYRKYNPVTKKYEADWDKWLKGKGQTIDQLKDDIKNDIQNNGVISEYRQTVSDLARRNNAASHISKSDLEKLSEMAERHQFDENFNAKVYNMLGLSDKESEAGRQIEELSKKVKQILDKGGKQSRIAMSKVLDDMNVIMAKTQGNRNQFLSFARQLEWWMGNRNAFRLLNYLNVMENNLSGVNQIIQTHFQSLNPEASKKEFKKMMSVVQDIAGGGKHFDMTDVEKLNYNAHEYRFDDTKSFEHNVKAALSVLPNLMLGVVDSAAHAYTTRMMFYNSAVLTNLSKLTKNRVDELMGKGYSEEEARKMAKSQQKEFKKEAIDNVTNALYDDTAEKQALKEAEEVLKLVYPNPTNAQIKREADNIMFGNMIKKGVLDEGQLSSLLEAADTSAKKAIGKESAISTVDSPLAAPFKIFTDGLSKVNRDTRARIKKNIQDGNLKTAAFQIIGNSIAMKGILPFISGAANWGIIALKKTPLGLLRAIPYNKKSFKDQIEKASELDGKKLGELMESYNSRRNDIYLSLQGMVWTGMILSAIASIKAIGGDDDEGLFEWINEQFKELAKDNRYRKMLARWLPPFAQAYNIAAENLKGNTKSSVIDNAGQLLGFGAMESPFTKAVKYTGIKHAGAGVGQVLGSIFDIGAYYNAANSYADLFGEQQEDKVKSHSTWLGDEAGVPDSDFINGIFSGMMGYNLHQDINAWTGFSPTK